MSRGLEVWVDVELGYAPKDIDTEKESKQDFIHNSKAMNALLSGMCEAEFIEVMHSQTAK